MQAASDAALPLAAGAWRVANDPGLRPQEDADL